jgi:hypothetical protein
VKAISFSRTDTLPEDVTGKAYYCPLCYELFSLEHLVEIKGKNYLTIEHNPPESMGGKGTILTCKNCNNTYGKELDVLVRELLTKESFLYSSHSTLSATFRSGSKTIKGKIIKMGEAKGVRPDPKSNPYLYKKIVEDLTNGKRPNLDFKLTLPDWTLYSLGILKIAYLKAFEYFGYHFADFGNSRDIHRVLRKELEYPVPNNGVFDVPVPDDYVGVHVVRAPEELKALIITLKFSFEYDGNKVEKNVPVVLPHPFPGGWEALEKYKKYFGKVIEMKTEKFRIPQPPIIKIKDYYEMFN